MILCTTLWDKWDLDAHPLPILRILVPKEFDESSFFCCFDSTQCLDVIIENKVKYPTPRPVVKESPQADGKKYKRDRVLKHKLGT